MAREIDGVGGTANNVNHEQKVGRKKCRAIILFVTPGVGHIINVRNFVETNRESEGHMLTQYLSEENCLSIGSFDKSQVAFGRALTYFTKFTSSATSFETYGFQHM